jgi:S-adenosylmethionine:tRNA ribosyltransferase-isomerase
MVINRLENSISHHRFHNLPSLLPPRCVLVFNQTKVFPARLFVHKSTGGKAEVLFIHPVSSDSWRCLASPRPLVGTLLYINQQPILETIHSSPESSEVILKFLPSTPLYEYLALHGHTPLPPYIKSTASESTLRRQYQPVFAKTTGSAAAPTASLHFTSRLLSKLASQSVPSEFLILHVGLGTFAPLTQSNLDSGTLHTEPYTIETDVLKQLNSYKTQGCKIIAVGTTTARCLESSASVGGVLTQVQGNTDIFIRPGYQFKFVDGLITNFHLPESSLLMLVSAFVSFPNTSSKFNEFNKSLIGQAYTQAVNNNYRFFSFGDGSLIL